MIGLSEIGRLWVSITAKTDEFQRGLSGVQSRLGNMSVGLQRFGSTMTRNVTLPMVAAGAGILALARKTGQFADELLDLSAATGISTDNLQRYRMMAATAGTSTDAVATSVSYLTRQMSDLNTFSARVERTAEAYNVQLRDMDGNARAAEDVHYDLMLAIASIVDPQERATVGAQAFGRQWEQLAPIVDLGVEAIERFNQMEVISREKLEKANEFREAWDRITHTLSIALMEAGIEVIEMLNEMFDLSPENLEQKMKDLTASIEGAVEWVKEAVTWWRELDTETQKLIGIMGGLIFIIGPVATVLANLIRIISGAITVVKWLSAILFGGGLGGKVALATALLMVGREINNFYRRVLEAIGIGQQWAGWIMTFVGGPVGAFTEGINQLSGYISNHGGVIKGVIAIYQDFINKIVEVINKIKEVASAVGESIIDSVTDSGIGGFAGAFDSGGIVPGPKGSPQLALVHGGETILPTHKGDFGKSVSINMQGLFSGANVTIGSEQDAKVLARELYKLTSQSARIQGVAI